MGQLVAMLEGVGLVTSIQRASETNDGTDEEAVESTVPPELGVVDALNKVKELLWGGAQALAAWSEKDVGVMPCRDV